MLHSLLAIRMNIHAVTIFALSDLLCAAHISTEHFVSFTPKYLIFHHDFLSTSASGALFSVKLVGRYFRGFCMNVFTVE
jgi:hypothetical protein